MDGLSYLAFPLLIVALVLFWISTNQWKLWVRGAIWAGGLAMLVLAWIFIGRHGGGLLQGLMEYAVNLGHPDRSAIGRAFAGERGGELVRFLLSLLDFFVILAFIIGVIALIAFTPGEKLERALRPFLIGTLGAAIGAALAMVVVGAGFGDRGSTYSEYIRPNVTNTAIDGDTLFVDGFQLRLLGIDAVERDQSCRSLPARGAATQSACGEQARQQLQSLVAGSTVTCMAPDRNAFSEGTFGYRLVECHAMRPGMQPIDLAQQLLAKGWALEYLNGAYVNNGPYRNDRVLAEHDNAGVWPLCTPRPDVWRAMSENERRQFANRGARRAGSSDINGKCPRPPGPGAPNTTPPPPPGAG